MTAVNLHEETGLSALARGMVGSEILKVAAEIRLLSEKGRDICNLTVGDFSPKEFPIPKKLAQLIEDALRAGETNYPPSDGVKELRLAVLEFFKKRLGLNYALENILIACGSRPLIWSTFASVVDPGDKVVYPTPSWNNNHYTYLAGGVPVEIEVGPESNWLPTADQIRPLVRDARLICINTPANPTGTVMARDQVEAIGHLLVEENGRRVARGERPLFLMWDQVYWMLTFGDKRHYSPAQLVPEAARWTIIIDGISKAFAATGLRVGWTIAPAHITARMRDILGHVGAWAPRPEQVAVSKFLGMGDAIDSFHAQMIRDLRLRLDLLYDGFESMRRDGLPVRAFTPQGAMYLSVQFQIAGRTNEEVRKLLLDRAGFAVVAFQAFGLRKDSGWFRLSAGAVSPQEIEEGLRRVRATLQSL
jgi:aspartate aminotransferase